LQHIISRLVLDVLKLRNLSLTDFALPLSSVPNIEDVKVSLIETDQNTESVKVTMEGKNVDLESIEKIMKDYGAVIQSIDEVVVKKG
jgi:hypothetical protein